jgi:hypothetical protein
MSVVEDVRQVLQDLLAPELRAVSARLDSLEKIMEARFESVDVKFDALRTQIQGISDKLDIDRRLIALESKQQEQASQ